MKIYIAVALVSFVLGAMSMKYFSVSGNKASLEVLEIFKGKAEEDGVIKNYIGCRYGEQSKYLVIEN